MRAAAGAVPAPGTGPRRRLRPDPLPTKEVAPHACGATSSKPAGTGAGYSALIPLASSVFTALPAAVFSRSVSAIELMDKVT